MATNITFHEGAVKDEERSELLNQKGATIWLTGLSASGKVCLLFRSAVAGAVPVEHHAYMISLLSLLLLNSICCTRNCMLIDWTVITFDLDLTRYALFNQLG